MVSLLIIADDFTGALDTGVQFAARGIATRVVADPDANPAFFADEVLVVDTETRHMAPEDARRTVAALTGRAVKAGVRFLYKKTDSALRGQIGAELSALLTASGEKQLPFLPAFPQTGRLTRGGIHYVEGVPVTESPFGADPFEPVRHASVPELIGAQSSLPVYRFPPLKGPDPIPEDGGILVFDASDDADLESTGRRLFAGRRPRILAGCAGFAVFLPELLHLKQSCAPDVPELDPRLLVVCGSVNPITLAQLDAAERAGFARLRLTPRQKLEAGYWETEEGRRDLAAIETMLTEHAHCIIESSDARGNQLTAGYAAAPGLSLDGLRVRIAQSLGSLVGTIFSSQNLGTLLLTGGDTLLQCMKAAGVRELIPVCELEKGVVLARFSCRGCTRFVITKSGGFGQETLFADLAGYMAR